MPETPDNGSSRPRHRWAEHELGELLTKAWMGGDPSRPSEPEVAVVAEQPVGELWEVDRLPSEAEGGIIGLLLNDPRRDATPAPPPAQPAAPGPVDITGSGMARLTEMLDRLPAEPAARLTPDDVEIGSVTNAPPAVWFWGDDDIYPGRIPGGPEALDRVRRRRRKH